VTPEQKKAAIDQEVAWADERRKQLMAIEAPKVVKMALEGAWMQLVDLLSNVGGAMHILAHTEAEAVAFKLQAIELLAEVIDRFKLQTQKQRERVQ
jgi:hypothetical protein